MHEEQKHQSAEDWQIEEFTTNDYLDILAQIDYDSRFLTLPFSIKLIEQIEENAVYLNSALSLKRRILFSCFEKSQYLSISTLDKLAQDYLYFGNAYIEIIKNKLGELLRLEHLPAKFMRKDKKGDFFHILNQEKPIKYKKDKIIHLLEPDINQEVYGKPDWLAVVTSALLNHSASRFRLRYYENGSHAGYILYVTDAANSEEDIENLKTALKASKGPGNFKNMMIYAPNGKKDGLQVIPISEVTAKDEFFNVKKVSRDDQLAATRTPPNLIGVVPENTGGFGSVYDAAKVFNRNEINPLQMVFAQINNFLNKEIIKFKPYLIEEETTEEK